jgi:hypothetical protein
MRRCEIAWPLQIAESARWIDGAVGGAACTVRCVMSARNLDQTVSNVARHPGRVVA